MCGRYSLFSSINTLVELFNLQNTIEFNPQYNIAPSVNAPIIIKNRIGIAKWGLIPPWVMDNSSMEGKLFNARSETISEKPSFQESWIKNRKCIIPSNGFYEWKKTSEGKQPFFLHHNQQHILFFAGLWAKTNNQVSFTILTKDAGENIKNIHKRMPVILTLEKAKTWCESDQQSALSMINQANSNDLKYHLISNEINKASNNDSSLIEDITLQQELI
jgi:putative SOS response-associated peptidase YedK